MSSGGGGEGSQKSGFAQASNGYDCTRGQVQGNLHRIHAKIVNFEL